METLMAQRASLITALCLSEDDANALFTGRSITALSRSFNNAARTFAICSSADPLIIQGWAELDVCRMYADPNILEALAWNTIWPVDLLQRLLEERKRLFLNVLRVYQLENSIPIAGNRPQHEIGGFFKLPTPISQTSSRAVLSDTTFIQRKQRLEKLQTPEHPGLEKLQRELAEISFINPKAKELERDLQYFLGWSEACRQSMTFPDWVQKIESLGHRSDETNGEKKSHYQAGTDFEVIVRDSLNYLGFIVDEIHQGGAGGIDVCCSAPYPVEEIKVLKRDFPEQFDSATFKPYTLVIECKSGKGIPDNTVEELERIAKRKLESDYESAQRLIIGPGKPSAQLLKSAKISKISIMNPSSLQKLVEFNHQYPNSINPLELKKYLTPEHIEDDIERYLETVRQSLSIRSNVVKTVKKAKDDGDLHVTVDEVRTRYNTVFAKQSSEKLSREAVRDLLIELSSPITGYLGRSNGDQFYFLRELQSPSTLTKE
jgi:hypothetical protein